MYLLVYLFWSISSRTYVSKKDQVITEVFIIISKVYPEKNNILQTLYHQENFVLLKLLYNLNQELIKFIEKSNYTPLFASKYFDDTLEATKKIECLDANKYR